jgi:hypothetical protein
MQRTTIKGDYGLGYFENDRTGDNLLEMTVGSGRDPASPDGSTDALNGKRADG